MGNFSEDIADTSPQILRGIPETDTSKVQVSFQVWANPRKSALRPRKQDLHESNLLKLLGNDYDHRWMKISKDKSNGNGQLDDSERKTVRILRELVGNSSVSSSEDQLQLPDELPAQYRELVKTWLVRRATCPIRFTWNDLGPYFWPRFVKKGECLRNTTCSWPPGMACTQGTAKILQILRWHCRNRKKKGKNRGRKKKTQDNNVTTANGSEDSRKISRRKKRKEYECFWIKVPYPVPEDCVCSCKNWQ
ncbi:hypothetical protein V9T40_007582 [Parthenolecanium corni]|uniref:Noggin n=1 Tax=Parthenolecanium corni TaxID=536013 RepID=A0AAN9THB9_9HEMI